MKQNNEGQTYCCVDIPRNALRNKRWRAFSVQNEGLTAGVSRSRARYLMLGFLYNRMRRWFLGGGLPRACLCFRVFLDFWLRISCSLRPPFAFFMHAFGYALLEKLFAKGLQYSTRRIRRGDEEETSAAQVSRFPRASTSTLWSSLVVFLVFFRCLKARQSNQSCGFSPLPPSLPPYLPPLFCFVSSFCIGR